MRVQVDHYGTGRVIARRGTDVRVLLDKPTGVSKSIIRPASIWAYYGEWKEIEEPQTEQK